MLEGLLLVLYEICHHRETESKWRVEKEQKKENKKEKLKGKTNGSNNKKVGWIETVTTVFDSRRPMSGFPPHSSHARRSVLATVDRGEIPFLFRLEWIKLSQLFFSICFEVFLFFFFTSSTAPVVPMKESTYQKRKGKT